MTDNVPTWDDINDFLKGGSSGGSDAVARQYPTGTEMWNSGFVAGRWDILSQFEEPEYYEAKPHKAIHDLLRILREYPS